MWLQHVLNNVVQTGGGVDTEAIEGKQGGAKTQGAQYDSERAP